MRDVKRNQIRSRSESSLFRIESIFVILRNKKLVIDFDTFSLFQIILEILSKVVAVNVKLIEIVVLLSNVLSSSVLLLAVKEVSY